MGVSALLNLAALALVGHFWRLLPSVAPPAPPKLLLLTLLPMQMVKPPPPPKPRPPAPRPKPPPPKPKRLATPLPPSPHQPAKIALAAAHTGGGAPPRPRPRPRPAARWHFLAPAAPQPDITQAAKTAEADQPDDPPVSSDGIQTAASVATGDKPGDAKGPDGDAPGNGDTKGQAGTGAGNGSGSGTGAGSGQGLFGTQDGGGGGGNGPRHIVYVLDISGSMDMTEKKFLGKRRIEQAREELTKQFQTLADGETFSLIAFSDEIRLFRPQLVKADRDTIRDAEKFLDRLRPDGDTDLEGALKAALAMPGVNVVVVITDGVPRTSQLVYATPEDFDKLAARIAAADSARVPIYAYGLLGPNPDGTDDSKEAAGLLTQIAADSGGKFEEVKLDGGRK